MLTTDSLIFLTSCGIRWWRNSFALQPPPRKKKNHPSMQSSGMQMYINHIYSVYGLFWTSWADVALFWTLKLVVFKTCIHFEFHRLLLNDEYENMVFNATYAFSIYLKKKSMWKLKTRFIITHTYATVSRSTYIKEKH